MKSGIPFFGAVVLLSCFISVAEAQTPEILAQPTNAIVLAGSAAAFSVSVSGAGPLTYQWQFNGTNLPTPVITTVAGNGGAGPFGDGGAAIAAQLNSPSGVAVDAAGNLFIADTQNNRIREVGTNGIITTVAGGGTPGYPDYLGDGGAATNARLSLPYGVALDAVGNLFIADVADGRIREVGTNGIITTVAGNGNFFSSGDGGPATNAALSFPSGVAVDAAGNLFIADQDNNRIRQVGTNGIISTVAGNGTQGYSGDGRAATKAELSYPSGVAVDASGNLFIADQNNSRVREVATNGIISTVAGVYTSGYRGDGGSAKTAQLSLPSGAAVDAFGNLFVADEGNSRIREVGTNGIITTVAGNGTMGYAGDGGATTDAELSRPYGVGVDASGNLFIADTSNNRIRKVAPQGQSPALLVNNVVGADAGAYQVVVSNLYGSVTSSVVTLQVLLPPALLTQPQGQWLVAGSNANLSVSATGTAPLGYQWYLDGAPLAGQTNRSLPLSAAGFTNAGAYTVAVTNLYGAVTSAVAVLNAGLPPIITEQPVSRTNLFDTTAIFSVAVSGTGPLTYQWQLDGADLPSGALTTVAGKGRQGYSGDGRAATNAELNNPHGVAVDASGNVFIADQYNNRVRRVATNGIITTVAGGGMKSPGDGGAATNAQLSNPEGVAVDASGNLFIADTSNNRIRKVGTNGIITTAAGNGVGYSGDGGPATKAALLQPAGVAVDASGNLFIADQFNNRIRKVGTNGIITTVAGNGTMGFPGGSLGDGGPATHAQLSMPTGVAVDAYGNLFIADQYNYRVRKVSTDGIITTVAGGGTTRSSGNGGPATNAVVSPVAVAVDASGNLFIAEGGADDVREVGFNGIITTVAGTYGVGGYSGEGVAPAAARLSSPEGVAVDAAGNLFIAEPVNPRVLKAVLAGPTLVLNNVGGANAGTYDLVVSSPYGSVTSSVVTLTVLLPPALVTQPLSQALPIGSKTALSVEVSGTAPFYYQWYFDGAPLAGQTNAYVLFSAARPADAGSYDVVVTNLYGSITSAPAVLILWSALAITEQPVSQTSPLNGTATFPVAVSGTGPLTYQWQFNGTNLPIDFITTAAGSGTAGYSGDGGPAVGAELNDPFSAAVDAAGNLFIADAANNCIRKVATNGLISTVAGSGIAGYAGDGGPATNAQLWFPYGVAVDGSGNLFIADWFSCRVRKVGTNGIISTVAGNGTPGYSGDGGAAAEAQLQYPYGVAVDGSGNLFIADSSNNVVREVGISGLITTAAGNGTAGYAGDGGPATSAELSFPTGLAVDASGNLFIADYYNHCIRELGTNGMITTAAGNGTPGYSGDGDAAAGAQLNFPYGVALDASANLFIADSSNNVVREVGISGIITTLAGDGTAGYSGDGGVPADAALNHPTGVAVDLSGKLFVADQNNEVIRMVPIPGPTLVLNNVTATNAGTYDVVVSSPYESVTSSVVTLTFALGLPPLHALLVGPQQVQLQFQGTPGASYLLLSATALTPPVDWRPVITNVAGPSGAWTFTDTNILSTRTRFYRMSSTGE